MNISRAISAVVLAGATALGAAGVASTAHAQEATATTATDEVAASATRRFWIENRTNTSLYVYGDAWTVKRGLGWETTDPRSELPETPLSQTPGDRPALDPEDALPPHGYQLLPGQNIEVEVAAWKAHAVALWLRTEEASPREAAVVMTVQGISRYSWGFSDDLQVNAGGQDITIRDRW